MKIPPRIRRIVRISLPILKRNRVIKAGIFGSAVRGELNKKSDIDFLIQLKGRNSLLDIVRLKHELEEGLKREVDLVEYEVIKPRIKERILQEQMRIL